MMPEAHKCQLAECDNPTYMGAEFCSEEHERLAHPLTFMCAAPECIAFVPQKGELCSEHVNSERSRRETDKPYEYVNHPKHYNEHPAGIECIDVIEHMSHNVGAAVKYLWRVGLKPGEGFERDLDKAIWYINREKERLAKAKK